MSESTINASIGAALAAIVAAFVWLVKRKGKDDESASDKIVTDIARIEREHIDLPENWRAWVKDEIRHQLNNRRAVMFAIIGLLERGHHERALTLLREEAEDLKQ